MAQPNPYNRLFNFSNYQSENPTLPLPAGQLDGELSRIKAVVDQIRTSIAAIQRDDYALANRSVGFDQLKTEIEIGINPPSAWATATNYVTRDTVFTNSVFYICEISHVSGVFATDLAAGKWTGIASFEAATSAGSVTFDGTASGLAASTVQEAIDEVDGTVDTLGAALAGLDAPQVPYDPTGRTYAVSTDVAGAIDDLDAAIVARGVLTGEVKFYAGSAVPTGYLWANGAAVSRSTYAALFAVVGTTYGVGDGSTTFNVPDVRGRAIAGRDNMGGGAAGRLTSTSMTTSGTALGSFGGTETHTLDVTQIPSHNHGGSTGSAGAHDHDLSLTISGSTGAGGAFIVGPQTSTTSRTTDTEAAHAHSISSQGGGAAHNNVQPTIILNAIIKT